MRQWACCHREPPAPDLFARGCVRASPLWWRVPIFAWAVGTIVWSTLAFWGPREKFLLYMTHWGLVMIALESLFGILVVVRKPKMEAGERLPRLVRVYWLLYNVAVPLAFLVTVFYWCILKRGPQRVKFAPSPALDAMLHGANSALMLLELALAAHPTRLAHALHALLFALGYVLFTVAYYCAGGEDPWGNRFIYPVIDWSKPDKTVAVVAATGAFLALMHALATLLALLRDRLTAAAARTPQYNEGFKA